MRAKFVFVSTILTMNALFIGYAVGFNSRKVLIIDKSLPPYVNPATAASANKKPAEKPAAPDKKGATEKTGTDKTGKAKGKSGKAPSSGHKATHESSKTKPAHK
jgi:hypothetical protein